MAVRRWLPYCCLRHAEAFILEQRLDFPFARAIDSRLHVEERDGH